MLNRLHRTINTPIRTGLSWHQLWLEEDKGLICCWERGRAKRAEDFHLALRAEAGELVPLAWEGEIGRAHV